MKAIGNLLVGLVVLTMATFATAHAADRTRIVAFGDSLMAGYGLQPGEGFSDKLQAALSSKGLAIEVVNAGVSGDTTKGGLARLDWSVPDGTSLVLLELGANDALRAIAPSETKANLDAMLARLEEKKVPVLLVGMVAPPNLGREYGAKYNRIFSDLSKAHKVALYGFFLDGVAAVPELNLPDGMHPNAAGIDEMVKRIVPHVTDALEAAAACGRSKCN